MNDTNYTKGHGFEDRVANLFRILGYRVSTRQTLAGREIDIVCERIDLPISVTYIVECKSGKVTTEDIDKFHSKLTAVRRCFPSHASSVPVVVHQGEIVGHALEHAKNIGIQCYEFVNLLRKIWPFDSYIQTLDQIYTNSGVENRYVPLDGITDDDKHVSLDEHLNAWLKDDQRHHMALLGDYGTGKTWLCLRIVKKMVDAFRAEPNSAPLPLLITFRTYRADTDLRSLIKTELAQEYGIEIPKPEALIQLLSSENVVLILDGMDEMARKLGERSALLGYYRLGLPKPGPKVLVTCRTHYFYSGTEQREVLNPNTDLFDTSDVPDFEVVHICLFDHKKIHKCIEQRLEEHERPKILRMIKSVYNLKELSSRPIFLQMICDSHVTLSDLCTPLTSALLYETYIQAWLKREMREGRLSLDPEEILSIIEDLAYIMVQRNILLLDPQEMRSFLSELLKRRGLSPVDCTAIERQIITSTFIHRSFWDKWEFAHRSFQEFFYARKFFRWEEETGGEGEFPVILVPIWQFVAQLALSRWNHAKALKWIPERIPRSEDPRLTLTTLRAAAAYWLIKKDEEALKDYPLAGVMLDCVNLQRAKFTSCNLEKADFGYSDLREASLSGAYLEHSSLYCANLENANLSYANLRQADCQGTSFLNADLTGAKLVNSRLRFARFNGANVRGADFRGADLGAEGSGEWLRSIDNLRSCHGVNSAYFDKNVTAYL